MPIMGSEGDEIGVAANDAAIYAVATVFVAVEFEAISLDYCEKVSVGAFQAWHGMLKPAVLSLSPFERKRWRSIISSYRRRTNKGARRFRRRC